MRLGILGLVAACIVSVLAAPLVVEAQPSKMWRIGVLMSLYPPDAEAFTANVYLPAFRVVLTVDTPPLETTLPI